jgi:hypothetical protein
VGSGLILLVIVGAWLAVLVPMALRSHETSASLTSVDRFSDAMRVLSRRDDRRAVVVPKAPREDAAGPTVAERRRRTLLVLLGSALLSLGLGLFGVPLMLGLHVLCDLLLVGFVVHLRRQAILKAERAARQRARQRATARPAAAAAPAAPRVTGIPDRMPKRPEPLGITLPAPAARYDDAAPVTVDTSWSPVPVPPPVYVGKAKAPSRPPRVLDLTKPGEWTAALEDAGLDILEEGPELEEILDRRRVAGDW